MERSRFQVLQVKGWQNFLLRVRVPERVFALDCGDRLNGVGSTDGLNAGF